MTGDEQAVKVGYEYLFDKNTFQKKEQEMWKKIKGIKPDRIVVNL